MHDRLKISHHRHTGRLLPHEHTSYHLLAFLLLLVGGVLLFSTVTASGDPPPQASSIGLTGTMPGPAPTVAATITTPHDQQRFSSSPITVAGTCPANTLVELLKNDIFAGSTVCSATGNYSLSVDLLIGKNLLVAEVFDALNQQGPNSSPVTVFYDALPLQGVSIAALNLGGTQLLLNTNAVYRGAFPGRQMSVPISILGGTPPYALNVQWGDTTNTLVSRNDNVTFNVDHAYAKPGIYQITLQASDSKLRTAFLTVAAIVNGQPAGTTITTPTKATVNHLLVLWPLYLNAATVVVSFWLGEKREKRVLNKPTLLLHPAST